MKGRYYIFILHLLFFISCKHRNLNSNEYIEWVENKENGLSVDHSFNDILFRVQYKPAEYILIKENKIATSLESDFSKSKNEVDNLYHFNFNFSSVGKKEDVLKKNVTDDQGYTDRLHYFSYDAQNDFKLIKGEDTLACVLYHFERSYGLSPYNTVVLGFEKGAVNKENSTEDLILFFKDHAFGNGNISLKIKASHINNTPKLIINEKSNS